MLSSEELESYVRQYYLPVYKYCMKKLSDKQDAEDAVQETFYILSKKAHLLENSHIYAWLMATAHNMVLRAYKRRYEENDRRGYFDDEMIGLSGKVITFEENLVDYYMEKHIKDVYSRLNENEKELFDLCIDGNISNTEMSKILGIDTHACSMRKKRLKDKCREIMHEILFY